LVIISDFENYNTYYQTILKWSKNPFTEIILLPGRYQSSGKVIDSVKFLKNNEIELRRFFHKKLMKERYKAFIFNDNRVEGQIISYLNFKQNGVNIYVEDGSDAYSGNIRRELNLYERLVARIVFGSWFENVKVLGTYKYIHEVLAFYPKIVRFELKKKTIKSLPETLFNELKGEFADSLLKNFGINFEYIQCDCFIVVSFSTYLESLQNVDYKHVYKQIGNLLQKYFNNIGVKYHPIEKKGDFLNLFGNHKFKPIPHSLPLEIIWILLLRSPPKFVVGDVSTALLTCNNIFRSTSVISIAKVLDLPYDYLFDAFSNVGVKTPKTLLELNSLLYSLNNLAGIKAGVKNE